MYEDLCEEEKAYYLKLAKEILKGTFVECNDCSIYSGSGYFISSYKDENKLNEVAKKLFEIFSKNTISAKKQS